jgi:integrase
MLKKRGNTYHCDFMVNGQRYRQSLETGDKREAIQRERDLIKQAKEGKLATGNTAQLARLTVEEAFKRYLPQRQAEIHVKRMAKGMADAKTEAGYAKSEVSHSKPLIAFFQGTRLNQVNAEDIQGYQSHRLGQGKAAKTVNHEVKLLLQLLKRAKLASRIRDDVELLPLDCAPRQMMTPAERQHLFETASGKPKWHTAYCAALLTANTTMRPIELRRLRWEDFEPFERIIIVRRSKTDAGTRIIPLNEEAWSAIAAMKQRADVLGAYNPEHFIFHRLWPKIDPERPMSSWRSAWRSLREKAGMPKLRYYDLRHQCVTEMLEAGVPEGVIREIAGHVDPAMTRHYSHPRLAARRAAVEVLQTVKPSQPGQISGKLEGSYGTNHGTKQLLPAVSPA